MNMILEGMIKITQIENFLEILEDISKVTFMPPTIKIKSIKDIEYRLSLGADKVTINTIAHRNSKFIYEASKEFGSQCIVVSIDAKKINEKYMVATNNGTLISNLECSNWAKEAEECGAGEIFKFN